MARAWTRGQAELRRGRVGTAQCVPRAWATAVVTSASPVPSQSDKTPNPNSGVRGPKLKRRRGTEPWGSTVLRLKPRRVRPVVPPEPASRVDRQDAKQANVQGDVSPTRGQGQPRDPAWARPRRQAAREAKVHCSPRSKTRRSPREDQRHDQDPKV